MALIKIVDNKQSTGKVKEAYEKMLKRTGGIIPKPFSMLSSSPDLLSLLSQSVEYYSEHPTLNVKTLAYIRLLVSHSLGYKYCLEFNAGMLQMHLGLTEEQLNKLLVDPNELPLEEKEKALILFVLRGITNPDSTLENDIKRLHAYGWTDKDILDASYHGADMLRHGTLFKMLKIDEED